MKLDPDLLDFPAKEHNNTEPGEVDAAEPEVTALPPGARHGYQVAKIDEDHNNGATLQMALADGWEPIGASAVMKPVATDPTGKMKRVGAIWFLRRPTVYVPGPAPEHVNGEDGD